MNVEQLAFADRLAQVETAMRQLINASEVVAGNNDPQTVWQRRTTHDQHQRLVAAINTAKDVLGIARG